jgi:hypothetical protein
VSDRIELGGGAVRGTTELGSEITNFVWKVPRHCPLVLLIACSGLEGCQGRRMDQAESSVKPIASRGFLYEMLGRQVG